MLLQRREKNTIYLPYKFIQSTLNQEEGCQGNKGHLEAEIPTHSRENTEYLYLRNSQIAVLKEASPYFTVLDKVLAEWSHLEILDTMLLENNQSAAPSIFTDSAK